MKKYAISCVLLLLLGHTTFAQTTKVPVEVTLCDLYQHPEEYIGRMVTVRGDVAGNDLWIDAFNWQSCSSWMRVIVVFPKDVKPSPAFELMSDGSFKQLMDALYGRRPVNIDAKFEGRFDSVVVVRDGDRIRIGDGYGKKRDYDGRIVLKRVSEVVVKPLPRK